MEISLQLHNSHWETVFTIPCATHLQKGRHGLYHEIVDAAGKISSRFGCYAWGTTDNICYIGSFSKDYVRGDHKSNFHGRVHNYLQNHRTKENGQKNTNLMVFDNVKRLLLNNDMSLFVFKFNYLEFDGQGIQYAEYCEDAELVRAVEQVLICSYKRNNECEWNRA